MCRGSRGSWQGPQTRDLLKSKMLLCSLQESLEQGVIPSPLRSTQDDGPVLRNGFRAGCYNLTRECDKAENLQKRETGGNKGSKNHIHEEKFVFMLWLGCKKGELDQRISCLEAFARLACLYSYKRVK